MNDRMPKVLVVATSRKTRGGIRAIVSALEKEPLWKTFSCRWIETQIDRNIACKLFYFVRSFVGFLWWVPRFDCVHFHTVPGNSVLVHFPFFLIAQLFGTKIILHLHVSNQLMNSTTSRPFRYLLGNADRVIVLSKNAAEVLRVTYEVKTPIDVVYNSCPPQSRRVDVEKEQIVLVAGILDQNKAYDIIIKAFAQLSGRHPGWRLVFAGNGELEKACQIASALGIGEKVEFMGWVSGEAKENLFSKATIYCLASYNEGFPVSVLEAWSYGLPVVCTPAGGLADVVQQELNAMVVQPGDVDQLAKSLEQLIVNPALREAIAARSHALVNEQFTQERMNRQLEDIYRKTAKND